MLATQNSYHCGSWGVGWQWDQVNQYRVRASHIHVDTSIALRTIMPTAALARRQELRKPGRSHDAVMEMLQCGFRLKGKSMKRIDTCGWSCWGIVFWLLMRRSRSGTIVNFQRKRPVSASDTAAIRGKILTGLVLSPAESA